MQIGRGRGGRVNVSANPTKPIKAWHGGTYPYTLARWHLSELSLIIHSPTLLPGAYCICTCARTLKPGTVALILRARSPTLLPGAYICAMYMCNNICWPWNRFCLDPTLSLLAVIHFHYSGEPALLLSPWVESGRLWVNVKFCKILEDTNAEETYHTS